MRLLLFTLSILLWMTNMVNAQSISGGVYYSYWFSKSMDHAIGLYNDSRPFLLQKQPLIAHGVGAELSYVFNPNKKVSWGMNTAYYFYQSKAQNPNYINQLLLNSVLLELLAHWDSAMKRPSFYIEGKCGLNSSGIYRRVNQEPFLVDDQREKAIGIGINTGIKIGYQWMLKEKYNWGAFLKINYIPWQYIPKMEAVINATQGLVNPKGMSAILGAAGISIAFVK